MSVSTTWLNKRLNKAQDKELTKLHHDGLYVRVRKSGAISFVFRYRYNKKQDKITLGSYPNMSLATATIEAGVCRKSLSEGKNPKLERKLDKVRYNEKLTVKEIVLDWWEQRYRDHPMVHDQIKGTPFQTRRSFELHIFPEFGDLTWDDVQLIAWSKLLKTVRDRSPHISLRLVTHIKAVGKYGTQHGLTNKNPLKGFSGINDLSVRKKKGQRILSYEEIRQIYDILDRTRSDERTKILFKLIIIYGCRTVELRMAEKIHFDFDRMLWTVPPELTKPKDLTDTSQEQPIVRPILQETIPLFDMLFKLSRGSKYLFPNSRKENDEPVGAASWLDVPNRINNHIARLNDGVTLKPWSKHDLRRSMRTHITKQSDEEGLSVPPWLAEKMLGHSLSGVFEVYDKNQYINEKLKAYKLWYKVLDSIWSGDDNIISVDFKKKAV